MTVVLLSNYFNHHQKPLSDALYRLTDGNFFFISNSQMREERRKLGYGSEPEPDYVLHMAHNPGQCREMIASADVVIVGSVPQELIRDRIRAGKLIFRYSERPLKHGTEPLKYIPRLLRWNWWNPPGKPIYLLCASAYAAGDYGKFGLFRNRAFRWGYFPETVRYTQEELFQEKTAAKILWAGRMLDWKHPEHALEAAKRLRDAEYEFELIMVGMGQLEAVLQEQIRREDLQSCVRMTGAVTPRQVRHLMEQCGIFLFTSNRQEGWGAVLNEAMNSGCAVIASHAIGSAPFLIQNEGNGLLYESGNVDMLYDKLKYLLDHPMEQKQMGAAAYRTITEEWNADVAAARLMALSEQILAGRKTLNLFTAGPCSMAGIQEERWDRNAAENS